MSRASAEGDNPEELPDPARRAFSFGMGLLPMLPLLPACGANFDQGDESGEMATELGATPNSTPASVSGVFRHPGLLATEDDFTRIRAHIKAGQEPWSKWWNKLSADPATALNAKPNPLPAVYRADGSKYALYGDIRRAWCLTLRWKLSDPQDTRYADKAVEFLDAWANTLKAVGTVPPGSTAHDDHTYILMAGMQGHQWAQVGEILRTYRGWPRESLKRFQDMLLTVCAPTLQWFLSDGRIKSHANWELATMVGAMAIGVFCDKPDLYRLAYDCFAGKQRDKLRNFGNGSIVHGVYYMHPGHMGQWEESGRDQGHSTLGMSLGGSLLEMAWNQGDDLYGLYNNRFLAAAEYVARSNLLDENGKTYAMPYVPEPDPYPVHLTTLWTQVNQSFQHGRNAWEPIYNHYVNRLGLAAPNVERMVALCEPNYWGVSDDIAFPTLIHRRPTYAGPMKPPSGLTAHLHDGRVVLSWWGSTGATAYSVRRGTGPNGPYAHLNTVPATELLTYTETPPDGVWFYQVTAQGPGAPAAGSNVVRIGVSGEQRLSLSLPLNAPNGTGTIGALLSPDGNRIAVEGKLLDGATWGEGRSNDKAIAFDGKSAALRLPPGIFNVDDFTVSMWVFASSLRWNTLLFAGSDANSYMHLTAKRGGGVRFGIAGVTFKDEHYIDSTDGLVPISRWVHVAATMRGKTVRLYVGGNEVGKADHFRLSPRHVGDQVTFLGRDIGTSRHDGRIQDFRVYSGALGAAEIAALAK